jgi:peroxiredoxin
MPALTAGKIAPDFTLQTMDGASFSLHEALKCGPVVLAFLKVSCPVCQYAFPYFERLYRGYKDKNVTVVGVSQNTERETVEFAQEFDITFPIALDDPANYPVSNSYGLTNVPTLFFIGSDGEIEISSVGWVKSEVEEVNRKIAETVGAGTVPVFRPKEQVFEWRPG